MMQEIGKGVSACPGVVRGIARVLHDADDVFSVQRGEVLVLPNSHPMFSVAVMNASAVICENGGRLSHVCIVSMEMGITCVTQVDKITKKIKNGDDILVDGNEGVIYGFVDGETK